MNTKQFDVISPDGFSIHPSDVYPTKKKAMKAFEDWKKRYEMQGYYSSMKYGMIPVEDLHKYIEIKQINS